MRPFVRGDIDGFFGLALDNLVQLLLIDVLCRFVLGIPPEILSGRILPGAAVSLLVGNLFYARQALALAVGVAIVIGVWRILSATSAAQMSE